MRNYFCFRSIGYTPNENFVLFDTIPNARKKCFSTSPRVLKPIIKLSTSAASKINEKRFFFVNGKKSFFKRERNRRTKLSKRWFVVHQNNMLKHSQETRFYQNQPKLFFSKSKIQFSFCLFALSSQSET
jgi:hypothetical protein